jgi:hypothetical protein
MTGVYVSGDLAFFSIPNLGLGWSGSYFGYGSSDNGYDGTRELLSYKFFVMPRATMNEKNTINCMHTLG